MFYANTQSQIDACSSFCLTPSTALLSIPSLLSLLWFGVVVFATIMTYGTVVIIASLFLLFCCRCHDTCPFRRTTDLSGEDAVGIPLYALLAARLSFRHDAFYSLVMAEVACGPWAPRSGTWLIQRVWKSGGGVWLSLFSQGE